MWKTKNDRKKKNIKHLIKDIKEQINKPITFKHKELQISTSIGIADFTKDASTEDELLKIADQRLYNDKQNKSR